MNRNNIEMKKKKLIYPHHSLILAHSTPSPLGFPPSPKNGKGQIKGFFPNTWIQF